MTSPVDGRRFRMLFEIDGVEPHEEDSGSATASRSAMPWSLRSATSAAASSRRGIPDTGEIDLDTLATLAGYRARGRAPSRCRSASRASSCPGRVRVGDAVRPVQLAARA